MHVIARKATALPAPLRPRSSSRSSPRTADRETERSIKMAAAPTPRAETTRRPRSMPLLEQTPDKRVPRARRTPTVPVPSRAPLAPTAAASAAAVATRALRAGHGKSSGPLVRVPPPSRMAVAPATDRPATPARRMAVAPATGPATPARPKAVPPLTAGVVRSTPTAAPMVSASGTGRASGPPAPPRVRARPILWRVGAVVLVRGVPLRRLRRGQLLRVERQHHLRQRRELDYRLHGGAELTVLEAHGSLRGQLRGADRPVSVGAGPPLSAQLPWRPMAIRLFAMPAQ